MNLVRSLAKRHPLALFFTLTFGIAWLVKPFALTDDDLTNISPVTTALLLLITLVPALATLFVLALRRDVNENRAVRQRLRAWRAQPRWYLLALAVNSATALAAVGITTALGARHLFTPAAFALAPMILLGAFGEELGWRGFVLPRLLVRLDAVRASLLLGAIAALWHLPLYLLEPPLPQSLALFLGLAASLPAQAIIMSWIYQCWRSSTGIPPSVLSQAFLVYISRKSVRIEDHFHPHSVLYSDARCSHTRRYYERGAVSVWLSS